MLLLLRLPKYWTIKIWCISDDEEIVDFDNDYALGVIRAPYEKPAPLRCIEPLYQLNRDGSLPGMNWLYSQLADARHYDV